MSGIKKTQLLSGLAGLLWLCGCQGARDISYQVLHMNGISWAFNISTSYTSFGTLAGEEYPEWLSLPVADGDLLYLFKEDGLELYHRYSSKEGDRLTLTFDTAGVRKAYVNDRLSFLSLTGSTGSLAAMRELSDTELKQVSTLYFPEKVGKPLLDALKQRESSLHGKGLVLEDGAEPQLLNELLSICRPEWLCADGLKEIPGSGPDQSLSGLELLWVKDDPFLISGLLKDCGGLSSMIISDWEPPAGETLTLTGMKKLTSVTLGQCYLEGLDQIDFPAGLERLHLIGCDTIRDIGMLQRHDALRSLSFSGTVLQEPLALQEGFKRLQWLAFPPNITDNSFRSVVPGLANLEIAELVECGSISDPSPLEQLDHLKVLIYQANEYDLERLTGLSQLDLLVLDQHIFDDSPDQIRMLGDSLPDTEIIPGSGICLGSGWLLLLLPLVLFFRFIIHRVGHLNSSF